MNIIHRHTQMIIFNYIITTHIPTWVHICKWTSSKNGTKIKLYLKLKN